MEVFQHGLQEHEALVFDRRAYEARKPFLYFCKAEFPLGDFRVGSDIFWRLYYKNMVRHSTAVTSSKIMSVLRTAKDRPEEFKAVAGGGRKKAGAVRRKTDITRVPKGGGGAPMLPPVPPMPPFY